MFGQWNGSTPMNRAYRRGNLPSRHILRGPREGMLNSRTALYRRASQNSQSEDVINAAYIVRIPELALRLPFSHIRTHRRHYIYVL